MATPQLPRASTPNGKKYQRELDDAVALLPTAILEDPPQWLGAILLLWECEVPYDEFNKRTFMP